jgi:hypothetical protein
MKTLVLLIAILASIATGFGQNPPQKRVAVSNRPSIDSPAGDNNLGENYSVKVQGGIGDSKPIDITLSGNGPQFSISLTEPILKMELRIGKKRELLAVSYAITAYIPVPSGNGAMSYPDTVVKGTYYATLGEPFTVLKVGEKTLTFQIDKSAETK